MIFNILFFLRESHYKVEFNATVQMASAIKEIRCPTHKIAVAKDATNMVTFPQF